MQDTAFLREIWWEERWLELEAEGMVDLPAYAGSTIRGALGTVMRPELCGAAVRCGERCGEPNTCPFFSLFEKSREFGDRGRNIPKPLILEPPLDGPLGDLARSGTVAPPYQMTGGRALPMVSNDWRIGVREGGRMQVGLRGVGIAGSALDGMVEGVRRKGLEVKGGRLRLLETRGERLSMAATEAAGQRARLAIVTPLLIEQEDAGICYDPALLGRLVLDRAYARAVDMYNAFFARASGVTIPFFRPDWSGVLMTGHRLFRYALPRKSYRQGRRMDFDGVVGWMEWEGDVGRIVPWLRAAEVLHVGQKATFGLGKVELTVS